MRFALFAFILLTFSVSVHAELFDHSQIIMGRPTITVASGESVLMDASSALPIWKRVVDKCTIYILQNDESSRNFGQVSRDIIDCEEFKQMKLKVYFTHYGLPHPTEHNLNFRVKYESESDLQYFSSAIQVLVQTGAMPSMLKTFPTVLTLPASENVVRLPSTLLDIRDIHRQGCMIAPNFLVSSYPKFGKLTSERAGNPDFGALQSCDDFFRAEVFYEITRGGDDLNLDGDIFDYLPMVMMSKAVGLLQHIALAVKVPFRRSQRTQSDSSFIKKETALNLPQVNFETNDQSLIPLTSSVFGNVRVISTGDPSIDQKINDFEIIYEVIQTSDYGDLVLADNAVYPVSSFSHQDVVENRVALRQKQQVKRVTIFNMKVRVFNSVTKQEQVVEIRFTSSPENLFAPKVELSRPLVVSEGTDILLSSDYLAVRHMKMSTNQLICMIESSSLSGGGYFTVNGLRRSQFTVFEVSAGSVKYTHNGNEQYFDNVVLAVKAGENETRVLLQILVNPVDDQWPIAARHFQLHAYLTLIGHSWKTLTPFDLFFTDKDSSLMSISYTVRTTTNESDVIFRKWDPSQMKFVAGKVTNWTQTDVIFGRIQCRNAMDQFNASLLMSVKLDVSDNAIFPNRIRHLMGVKLVHLDVEAPKPSDWAAMYLECEEYKSTIITKQMLEFVDEGALTASEITFKITTRPYDKNPYNPLKVGHICLLLGNLDSIRSENMDCNVKQFTQDHVNRRRVVYVPPIGERAVIMRFIEFIFSVSDAAANVVSNQYFSINLKPLANSPPRVYVRNLRVQSNYTLTLTQGDLEVIDPEGLDPVDLEFTIREFPSKVMLLRDGIQLSSDGGMKTFSSSDLVNERITLHVGDFSNTNDTFQSILSDGVNLIPIRVNILIDSFNEYSVQSQVTQDEIAVSIYVRQSSAASLALATWRYFEELTRVISSSSSYSHKEKLDRLGHLPSRDDHSSALYSFTLIKPKNGELQATWGSIWMTSGDTYRGGTLTLEDLVGSLSVIYKPLNQPTKAPLVKDVFRFKLDITPLKGFYAHDKYSALLPFKIEVNVIPDDVTPPVIYAQRALSVSEGGKALLDSSIVYAEDPDSLLSQVICYISRQPSFGYVANVDASSAFYYLPVSSFYMDQLYSQKLAYIQSLHTHRVLVIEPETDLIKFICSDGRNYALEETLLEVSIEPANDEAPRWRQLQPITVQEGSSVVLGRPYFSLEDWDLPKTSLNITVLRKPLYGTIMKRKRIFSHTGESGSSNGDGSQPKDLMYPVTYFDSTHLVQDAEDVAFKPDTIVYKHSGSENFRDSFTLQISDAFKFPSATLFTIVQQLNVSILKIDDEMPILTKWETLVVTPGSKRCLDSGNLQTADADTDVLDVRYIVKSTAQFGEFSLKLAEDTETILNYGDVFDQSQIDKGLLCYVAYLDIAEAVEVLTFDLSDGVNTLRNQQFNVSIKSSFELGLNFTVVLQFSTGKGDIALTSKDLIISDITLHTTSLWFEVSRLPSHGDVKVIRNKIYEPRTKFLLTDLLHNLVIYYHDVSFDDVMDSFQLQLVQEDVSLIPSRSEEISTNNKVLRTFNVAIIDPTQNPMLVSINPISVLENSSVTFSTEDIKVEQNGRVVSEIEFYVTQNPFWGNLYSRSKASGTRIVKFSMSDVSKGDIYYRHSGRDVGRKKIDVIGLKMADSRRPSVDCYYYMLPNSTYKTKNNLNILISLVPLDNKPPEIYINSVSSDILEMGDAKHKPGSGYMQFSGVPISSVNLRAFDPDSDLSDVLFVVAEVPKKGFLCRRFVEAVLYNFTQQMLDEGTVGYCLPHGSTHDEDKFTFVLQDKSGNRSPDVFTHLLSWSYVSFEKARYSVREPQGNITLKILRRGYPNTTIYVEVDVIPVSSRGDSGLRVSASNDVNLVNSRRIKMERGQLTSEWTVQLLDDDIYEGVESFEVFLTQPLVGAIDPDPNRPFVTIVDLIDEEDRPTVEMVKNEYEVAENVGEVSILLRRSGDLTKNVTVYCYTIQETAESSRFNYRGDFVALSDKGHQRKFLSFLPGQSENVCNVTINDDQIYEPEVEQFSVHAASLLDNDFINKRKSFATVRILPDPIDMPSVRFVNRSVMVEESDRELFVVIAREGPDLSHICSITVSCDTPSAADLAKTGEQLAQPVSAAANGEDMQCEQQVIVFHSNVKRVFFRLWVQDDFSSSGRKTNKSDLRVIREGVEAVKLSISNTSHCRIQQGFSSHWVFISDNESDRTRLSFAQSIMSVSEDNGTLWVPIVRTGDSSDAVQVVCSLVSSPQSQNTFKTTSSVVSIPPGADMTHCTFELINDQKFIAQSSKIEITLQLRSERPDLSKDQSQFNYPLIVSPNSITVTLLDDDVPQVYFAKTSYDVEENDSVPTEVQVEMLRSGDLSLPTRVIIASLDVDSATQNLDFIPIKKAVTFQPGENKKTVTVVILPDTTWEIFENFILQFSPANESTDTIYHSKRNFTTVFIRDKAYGSHELTFPQPPKVISLKDLQGSQRSSSFHRPVVTGAPLICLSGCDERYEYNSENNTFVNRFISTCAHVNNSRTIYTWLLYPPAGQSQVPTEVPVDSNVFHSSWHWNVLDPVFLVPGYRVQCITTAVATNGQRGDAVKGEILFIEDKLINDCHLSSMSSNNKKPSLKVKLEQSHFVQFDLNVPIISASYPVVSLNPNSKLTPLQLVSHLDALVEYPDVWNNFCQSPNSLSGIKASEGFVKFELDSFYPEQHKGEFRSALLLNMYSNLDYTSCSWRFQGNFSMEDLFDRCGIKQHEYFKVSEQQTLPLVKSMIPVSIHQIMFDPQAMPPDMFRVHTTELEVHNVYTYSTSDSEKGQWYYGTPPEKQAMQSSSKSYPAAVFPTGVSFFSNKAGRESLGVNFSSRALVESATTSISSSVYPTFTADSSYSDTSRYSVTLKRTSPTKDNEENWIATIAKKEGSGSAYFGGRLFLPVMVCRPGKSSCEELSFKLDLKLVSLQMDVVPYSSSTSLEAASVKFRFKDSLSSLYRKGDRVDVEVQKNSVKGEEVITVVEAFVCRGQNGYMPQYSSEKMTFGGCKWPHKLLIETSLTLFTTLDGSTIDKEQLFQLRFEGSSRFSFSTVPLFSHNTTDVWMLHLFYVRDDQKKSSTPFLLSAPGPLPQHISGSSDRPAGNTVNENSVMVVLPLTSTTQTKIPSQPLSDNDLNGKVSSSNNQGQASNGDITPVAPIIAIAAISIVISCFILAVYLTRKKKERTRRLIAKQAVLEKDANYRLTSPPQNQLNLSGNPGPMYLSSVHSDGSFINTLSNSNFAIQNAPSANKRASALKNSNTVSSNSGFNHFQNQFYQHPNKHPTVVFSPQVTTIHDETPTCSSVYADDSFDRNRTTPFYYLESNA